MFVMVIMISRNYVPELRWKSSIFFCDDDRDNVCDGDHDFLGDVCDDEPKLRARTKFGWKSKTFFVRWKSSIFFVFVMMIVMMFVMVITISRNYVPVKIFDFLCDYHDYDDDVCDGDRDDV